MKTKEWTVQVLIEEDETRTEARAVMSDGGKQTATGRGVARRNPLDREVPAIGDELAVSRALEDLASRLHDMASHDFAYLAGPSATV